VEHDAGKLFNGRRVTAVALRGEYPDTELVVTFVESTGNTHNEVFDIWRSDPPGDVTDANDAGLTADLIWVGVAGM
jgi:hypothetical protein